MNDQTHAERYLNKRKQASQDRKPILQINACILIINRKFLFQTNNINLNKQQLNNK